MISLSFIGNCLLFLYAILLAGKTNFQNPIWNFLVTTFPDEDSEIIPLKLLWKIQKDGKHPELNSLFGEISKEISDNPSVNEAWKLIRDEGKTENSSENSVTNLEKKKLMAKRKEEILMKFRKEQESFLSQSVKKKKKKKKF